MKDIKQRISILIVMALIFQIITFGINFNNVYAQNIDSESYLKKSLNTTVLTKNSDIDENFDISSIMQETLKQNAIKNVAYSFRNM